MAVYKVPQDVEAEDKLLGPFSFKQFVFLMIAVAALALAFALSRVLLPLALIPVPVALFFGAIALPLRKDQPTEVYLAAVISFLTKPKVRIWKADGIDRLFEVVAPQTEERTYSKGYDQAEVQRRLAYLANLVDSQGWSVRGVTNYQTAMQPDLYNEAQAAEDVLADDNSTTRNIDSLIARSEAQRKQAMMNLVRQQSSNATAQPTPTTSPAPQQTATITSAPPAPQEETTTIAPAPDTSTQPFSEPAITLNPYPTMRQSVLTPLSEQPAPRPQAATQPTPTTQPAAQAPQPAPTTSPAPLSPAIIDLANNHSDLSVETLQREANRIKQREDEDEVVISLR